MKATLMLCVLLKRLLFYLDNNKSDKVRVPTH